MEKKFMTTVFRSCFILIIASFVVGCGGGNSDAGDVPLGSVSRGTLYLDLYEEGEVEAVNSVNISSPMVSWRFGSTLKINWIVKDGAEVNTGDTMVMFDPSDVQKGIMETESALEVNLAELKKMEAQHKSDLEELRADYQVSEIAREISKIRFESAAYESEIKKREIQLNLDKADISLARAKEQIENRIKIQREDIKQKNLLIKQSQNQLNEAHETLAKLCVTTKSPGIAIVNNNRSSGGKFKEGDQTWGGYALILLPDLNQLKATVKINEVDISKITKGMEVEIRPDAFSEQTYKGRVNSVANLAVNKDGSSKIKVFPVEILIEGKNKDLLPGLTVSCRIIVNKLEDVLYVPITALHEEAEGSFVYVKTGNGYSKTEVQTGQNNSDYVVIVEGLKEGDNIALTNPYAGEKQEAEGENLTK